MAALIQKQGGDAFVAQSMREVPLDRQDEAFDFATRLLRGDFDAVMLLTGVGMRLLWKTLLTRYTGDELKEAFRKTTLAVRGPKPSAALRELGLVPSVQAPEPNTWRELLSAMAPRHEKHVALQEYGRSNTDLIEGLRAQGRTVTPVRIYGWDLPEDVSGLRQAAARLVAGQIDVILLTTSMQVVNLMRIAEEEGLAQQVREAFGSAYVASIGPTTSEALEEYGLKADFEPSHPRMGILVNEAAGRAVAELARKR